MQTPKAFPDEVFDNQNTLIKSLMPLLRIMKSAGLYFTSTSVETKCIDGAVFSPAEEVSTRPCKYLKNVNAVWWMVLFWTNAVRFLLAFESHETFDALLVTKMSISTIYLLCAILQTSYFYASCCGLVDNIFHRIRVTSEFSSRIRKLTLLCVASSTFQSLLMTCFVSYALFTTDGYYNFILTPMTTHIPIDGFYVVIARIVCVLLVQLPCYVTWLFSHSMNHILVTTLRGQFNVINHRFRQSVMRDGRFEGDIRNFRHRHQILCNAVKEADRFFRFSNVGSFCCEMFVVIFVFYSSIFTRPNDPLLVLMLIGFAFGNATGLMITIAHGIMVNDAVSMIRYSSSLVVSWAVNIVQQFLTEFGEALFFSKLEEIKLTMIMRLTCSYEYFSLFQCNAG
jgi:hypothetical protein